MIRPTVPADSPELLTLTQATGVFKELEIVALQEVLNDYHSVNHTLGHQCVTLEDKGHILGFSYFAPAAMTDRTWYLYWIAVRKQTQARGLGQQLLVHTEEAIRKANGRILLIETSSLPHYGLTRKFYLKYGYDQEGRLRDFYADGDDLIVFRKRLTGADPRS
jgi:ribosomal protein S18 acetylase RimI-like enzyme